MQGTLIVVIIAGLLLGLLLFKFISPNKRKSKPFIIEKVTDLKSVTIADIDKMEDGTGFEMYLYRLFLELGYSGVYKTLGSRDFGADVIFTDRHGIRNVIQAKRYSVDNTVGVSAVQEVYSSMRYYKAKKAIVITSSRFTEPCETLAGINHVKLLDRSDLANMIEAFKRDDRREARDIIEAKPRMILESWNEANNTVLHKIRKDYKAEKHISKVMGD
ncbi:endonuclease [Bacillus sp. FJAT-27264]|uniref:restriction endonuclease n=1 Tax=Paenibacillus sp. (strain DSM 101736 / FJAT-27264) TaxID=1850362 RepID=UPI000807CC12|nr:restriction endonuclease [Bacillus sp. FJAT-27264]OBZ19041.1 endonuclease [Bacillus sp. FJAT-27264]